MAGFGAGTGSAFSLLPAQNATGNWIKIVQRVPVRVALDPAELAAHPLQIGLSMRADVDVRDGGAARGCRSWRNDMGSSTDVFDTSDALADPRAAIIARQRGGRCAAAASARRQRPALAALLAACAAAPALKQ